MEYLPVSVARLFSDELKKTPKRIISDVKMTTNAREHRGGRLGKNVKNAVYIFV